MSFVTGLDAFKFTACHSTNLDDYIIKDFEDVTCFKNYPFFIKVFLH
jgi:hypothetical protein